MLGDGGPPPDDVLEEMGYLSRSQNRIQILNALVMKPHSPREIAEKIDISRSSLRRILTELVERGWANRTTDGDYTATQTGRHMATETDDYLRTIQAIRTLGAAVSWLPTDELAVGLECFQTATIIGPERNAAVAPDTYAIDRLRETTEFRNLVNIAPTLGFEKALHGGVAADRLTAEHIVTKGVISYLCERGERRNRWREYLEAGASMYRYDGRIPCNLFIMDETVFIAPRELEGLTYIEVENEDVLSWAHNLIDEYVEDADQLDAMTFTDDRPAPTDRNPGNRTEE